MAKWSSQCAWGMSTSPRSKTQAIWVLQSAKERFEDEEGAAQGSVSVATAKLWLTGDGDRVLCSGGNPNQWVFCCWVSDIRLNVAESEAQIKPKVTTTNPSQKLRPKLQG